MNAPLSRSPHADAPWFHAERRLPEVSPNQLSAVHAWLPEDEQEQFANAVEFEFDVNLCANIKGAKSHLEKLIRRPEEWASGNLTNTRKWLLKRIKAFLEERQAIAEAKIITDGMGAV